MFNFDGEQQHCEILAHVTLIASKVIALSRRIITCFIDFDNSTEKPRSHAKGKKLGAKDA